MESRFKRRGLQRLVSLSLVLLLLVTMAGVAGVASALVAPRVFEVVSVGEDGTTADSADPSGYYGYDSYDASISDTGRYVAFTSFSYLSSDDLYDKKDVYRRDRLTGVTELVSKAPEGATNADRGAHYPSISDDGRYVSFTTGKDLVPEDTNGDVDLYVADMETGAFRWIDLWSEGVDAEAISSISISGDGSTLVWDWYDMYNFPGDEFSYRDVFAYELATDTLTWVSAADTSVSGYDRGSRDPSVSDDGRYVLFYSGKGFDAEDTNGSQDFYLMDLESDTLTWLDMLGDGTSWGDDAWEGTISGDGTKVVFEQNDQDVYPGDTLSDSDVFCYDIPTETLTWITDEPLGQSDRGSRDPSISDNGRFISFYSGKKFVAEDTDGQQDFYLYDMDADEYYLIQCGSSLGSDPEDMYLSGDGSTLVFESEDSLAAADDNDYDDVYVLGLPMPKDDAYTAVEDTVYTSTGSIFDNDGPIAVGIATPILVQNVSHGSLVLNANGTFTYTPNINFAGTDTFKYTFSDGLMTSPMATVTITVTDTFDVPAVPIYRFFNVRTGTHFYTASLTERDYVIKTYPSRYHYEGVAYSVQPGTDTQPLYRFYNKVNGEHLYTADPQEKAIVEALWSKTFKYEGIAYYVSTSGTGGKTPIYRFLNMRNSAHFYTASGVERDHVMATWPTIYHYEGIAFFVSAP